jgi:hypothetical protein
MSAIFQVTDYYKLLALHKALIHTKFARQPTEPIISGSPFIAEMANQIVETLAQMEIERGHPERAQDWRIKIDPTGEVWDIALSRINLTDKVWQKWTLDEKKHFARLLLSPFEYDEQLLLEFIRQADERVEADN